MKRFLSWVVLVVSYYIFDFLTYLVLALCGYLMGLIDELSVFTKLLIWIIGGSFFFGILVAPLWYGIPAVYRLSESVCESRKGLRYTLWGAFICFGVGISLFQEFTLAKIFLIIFGIAMIVIGHNTRKERT